MRDVQVLTRQEALKASRPEGTGEEAGLLTEPREAGAAGQGPPVVAAKECDLHQTYGPRAGGTSQCQGQGSSVTQSLRVSPSSHKPELGRVLGSERASSPRHEWAGGPWGAAERSIFRSSHGGWAVETGFTCMKLHFSGAKVPCPLSQFWGRGSWESSRARNKASAQTRSAAGCSSEFRPGKPTSPRLEPTGPVAGLEPGSGAEREGSSFVYSRSLCI